MSDIGKTEEPVMLDGKLHNFMFKVRGSSFRCECGCNVFHKPDKTQLDLMECNACGDRYRGE